MSALETSFVAYRLNNCFENLNKRLVNTQSVFYDTGLTAYLLGIRSTNKLNVHFAKDNLFENLLITKFIENLLI